MKNIFYEPLTVNGKIDISEIPYNMLVFVHFKVYINILCVINIKSCLFLMKIWYNKYIKKPSAGNTRLSLEHFLCFRATGF